MSKHETPKIFKFNDISLINSILEIDEFNIYIALRYKAQVSTKTLYQRTKDNSAKALTRKRSVLDLKVGGSGMLKSVDDIEWIAF